MSALFAKIRELSTNVTIYGLGDVAVSIVNFFLLGLYVKYLVAGRLRRHRHPRRRSRSWPRSCSASASTARSCGSSTTADDDEDRQRLASTIFFFLLAVNGAVLAVLLVAAPALSRALFSAAAPHARRCG